MHQNFTQSFSEAVRAAVKKIPKGEVRSYGEIAAAVGRPGAARAVANVMANNFDPSIPCHRVILGNGQPGGYNRGGAERKRAILRGEGVTI